MRHLLALLAVLLVAGASSVASANRCVVRDFESGMSDIFAINEINFTYSVAFYDDSSGGVLGLRLCWDSGGTNCKDLDFDTDGDGLADTNLLDGSTIEKTGVKDIKGTPWLEIYASTNPSSGSPVFAFCREST